MRSLLASMMLAALAAATGCSSDNFYRGRVEAQGAAHAQAFHVVNGVEQPVSDRYSVEGQGTATVQTSKPFLTLDGAWTKDAVPAGTRVREEKGAVVVRPTPPGVAPDRTRRVFRMDGTPLIEVPVDCPNGQCPVPAAAAPCPPPPPPPPAPAAVTPVAKAVDAPTCNPVYRSCDGTAGGHRPEPYGAQAIPEPGTGWPCPAKTTAGKTVMGVVMIPPGFLIHVGECFVAFLRCVVTFF